MSRADEVYRLEWAALSIVLAPIAVFIASNVLFNSFGAGGIHLSGHISPDSWPPGGSNESAARLYVLIALIAFGSMAAATVLLFLNDFLRTYGFTIRVQLIVGMAGGILLAWIWQHCSPQAGPPEKFMGRHFVELTEGWARMEGCGPSGEVQYGPWCYFQQLRRLVVYAYTAIPFLIAILIAGTGSCLGAPVADDKDLQRIAVDRQQRRLQAYVICAAALLAMGVLLELAWTRWPLSALGPVELAGYEAYVDALAMFFGVTYSVMIASYAIPVAVLLQMRRAALSLAPEEAGERPGLLDNGLIDALGKILTVLAPALAGAVPVVLDLIKHGSS